MLPHQVGKLGGRLPGAGPDLFERNPAQWMRDLEQRQLRHAKGARLRLAQLEKWSGINDGGDETTFPEFCHVVDTPRRARSSVGHCADDEVSLRGELIEHLLGSRRAGIVFSQGHYRGNRKQLTHAVHHEGEQMVGVVLGIVERAYTDATRLDLTLLTRLRELVQRGFGRYQEYFLAHRMFLQIFKISLDNPCGYSGVMPAWLATFCHFSISVLMYAACCSGVLPTGTAPRSSSSLRVDGS